MKQLLMSAVLIFGLAINTVAQEITLFGASDLRYALDEVKALFLESHPNDRLNMIYGSSGKGMHQIENGAPYDIYFSANMDFVQKLYEQGDIITQPKLYAIGRVVIWSKSKEFEAEKGFENLTQAWVKKIAIANPLHAPYGEKAKQALESMKLYDSVQSQLVLGENISQTVGFIASETADIGIVALSMVLVPAIAEAEQSSYYLIDAALHEPLRQGYGLTKYSQRSALAQEFYDFMQTPEAQEIMKKHGFERP